MIAVLALAALAMLVRLVLVQSQPATCGAAEAAIRRFCNLDERDEMSWAGYLSVAAIFSVAGAVSLAVLLTAVHSL